jgi:hypothetical protein
MIREHLVQALFVLTANESNGGFNPRSIELSFDSHRIDHLERPMDFGEI